MKNELNKRQWKLYEYLKSKGDEWTPQIDIAIDLVSEIPEYNFNTRKGFHDTQARQIMTADIRAINESSVIQKVIISSWKGIKIANKDEFDRYIRKEIMASVRRLLRAKIKAKKGGLDGQTRITFGEYERDTIKAFIDSDKDVGERLKTARLENGLKAKAVCTDLKQAGVNIDEPMLSRFEHGYAIPNGRTLAKLAQIYRTSVEYLLTGELPPEEETSENDGLQAVKGV